MKEEDVDVKNEILKEEEHAAPVSSNYLEEIVKSWVSKLNLNRVGCYAGTQVQHT